MKKKILALIISLTMVMGTFSVALAVPSDVIGTPYEESVERLFDLGVVIGYPDGSYGPNDNITREEYSVIAIKTKQLEERANNRKGDTVFGDVEANSWSTGYVNVAEEEKLIVGIGPVNGVNSFGPKLNLTYEQAVAIVLRAIGYEPEVADKGGWPDGYLAVASEIGLLDGINGTKGMLATRGMVAELTYNALEIPNMIKVGSDYIVSGTQGTDEVYLFNELHMINEAAASGNWGDIDEDTFQLAGITGVNAGNLSMIQDKLESLADGDNQNWSPKAIKGVLDSLDEEEVAPITAEVDYINAKEFDVTLPTGATGTYVVRVGTESQSLTSSGRVVIPGALWTLGEIRTVELVKLSNLSDVLASKNFVVEAATGIIGSDAAPTPGVAPVTAVTEVPGVDTVMFNGTFSGGQTVTIDGITLPPLTGGNNIATAANVRTLVGAHATLGPKYTVVDDLAGKLTFTETAGNVDGVALTATTSSNIGTVTASNTTLGTIGVAPSPGTAQVNTLTISGPATAAGEIKVTFDDGNELVKTVAVDNGDTATVVAGNITTEFAGLNGWTVTSSGNIVTFTADAPAADKTVTIKVVEN